MENQWQSHLLFKARSSVELKGRKNMLGKFYANPVYSVYSTKFKDHNSEKENHDSAIQAEAHMFAETRKKGKTYNTHKRWWCKHIERRVSCFAWRLETKRIIQLSYQIFTYRRHIISSKKKKNLQCNLHRVSIWQINERINVKPEIFLPMQIDISIRLIARDTN